MIERDLHLVAMTGGRLSRRPMSRPPRRSRRSAAPRRAACRSPATPRPPYFALNEIAVGDYRTFAKLSPPLRSEADRQAIAAAVADGTIDCVASDHAPHDQESKRVPFAQAAPGVIGLETLLPLTLRALSQGRGAADRSAAPR